MIILQKNSTFTGGFTPRSAKVDNIHIIAKHLTILLRFFGKNPNTFIFAG
jgi:hypothetical protein